jgi:hypothetical protein
MGLPYARCCYWAIVGLWFAPLAGWSDHTILPGITPGGRLRRQALWSHLEPHGQPSCAIRGQRSAAHASHFDRTGVSLALAVATMQCDTKIRGLCVIGAKSGCSNAHIHVVKDRAVNPEWICAGLFHHLVGARTAARRCRAPSRS